MDFEEQIGLPNFNSLAKSVQNPQNLLGVAGNAIFHRDDDVRQPRPKVLSSSTTIRMLVDGAEFDIGELKSFSARKDFRIVQQWKPFGYLLEEVITEDDSWYLNFSGDKVDWKGAYLIYTNELALRGIQGHSSPSRDNTISNSQSLYIRPTFTVNHITKHYDGTIESYNYGNVIFLNYDIQVAGDNSEIPETFSAIAQFRTKDESFTNLETNKINSSVAQILKAIQDNGRF